MPTISSASARGVRWVIVAALAAAISLAPRSARAEDEEVYLAIVAVAAVALANTTFTVYHSVLAERGELPDQEVAFAQAGYTTLEVIGFVGFIPVAYHEEEEELALLLWAPGCWATQLHSHGIWAGVTRDVDPVVLLGASWAIGANVPLTVLAITNTVEGKWSGIPTAILEIAATTPQIVITTLDIVNDEPAAGRAVILGWASLLAAHGTISIIAQALGEENFSDGSDDFPQPARRSQDVELARGAPRWSIGALAVPDVSNDVVPGFGAFGAF